MLITTKQYFEITKIGEKEKRGGKVPPSHF
jgi:hypothetical protein